MERKSSKGYSVVFLVEGEKFKLRNLPSAQSAHRLSLQHLAVVLTPNIAEVINTFWFFSVHNHGFFGGPNTFSQQKHPCVCLYCFNAGNRVEFFQDSITKCLKVSIVRCKERDFYNPNIDFFV